MIDSARPSIVDTVSAYVTLKRAGREYCGLCPLHAEKTPSFYVNEEKGVAHCFGCGWSGDVFDFVMKIEGLTFPEALAHLGLEGGRSPRPRTSGGPRRASVQIAEWARQTSSQCHEILRDIGARICLAKELGRMEEVRRLEPEWVILSDLDDDLFNPKFTPEIYRQRGDIERLIDGVRPV